jgi:hypothetical protein
MPEPTDKVVINVSIHINVNFVAGLIVGIINSIAFHPLDKAFYLRSIDPIETREHLCALKYWEEPLAGLRTTFYQRIFSSSIYFMMQGELGTKLKPVMQNQWRFKEYTSQMAIGLLSGFVTGFFSNASYAVKYYTINYKPKGKPLENSIEMWRQGGLKPFFNGIYPGASRDMLFGVFYESTNYLLDQYLIKPMNEATPEASTTTKEAVYFGSRFFSATIATTISSPLNYARNIQFKTSPQQKQPSVYSILRDVWRESNQAIINKPGFFSRALHLQDKLMLGVGTARAGLGMALGQLMFNHTKTIVRRFDNNTREEPSKASLS